MSKSSKDYVQKNIDVFEYIPEYLKNDLNSSFSRNLFNKFLTKEEAVPVYGVASDMAPSISDARPLIPQKTTERKINTLIPMIYAKHGVDETVLSFSDIINKAKLQGINVSEFSDWGACQSFNFMPPIDIDKFINFSNYFWSGKLSKSTNLPSWNKNLDPEFYVIAKPTPDNKKKFPVDACSTGTNLVLTGSGHKNEVWTIEFTTSTTFKITGSLTGEIAQSDPSIDVPYVSTNLSFFIGSGTIPFAIGDTFVINVEDLSSTYSFTYTGVGNGGISGVKGSQSFQLIGGLVSNGGVQTYEGQRILVKDQDDVNENGIYIVNARQWQKAEDSIDANILNGAEVFVSNNKTLWSSIDGKNFEQIGENSRNVSEWTEFNFWFHRDDAEKLGIDINKTIQALRPIIEYDFNLEMNTDYIGGKPSGGNIFLNNQQRKTKFNQLPLFNLYQVTGAFAEKTSAIFHYEESSSSPVDAQIKRRVKQNQNFDFVFSQGCVIDGKPLFFKINGELKSIWAPGPIVQSATDTMFASPTRQIENAKVSIVIDNIDLHIKNANWIANAKNENTFTLTSKQYPTIKFDVNINEQTNVVDQFGAKLFSIFIPFDHEFIRTTGIALNDYVKFKTINSERARYVTGETLDSSIDIAVDHDMVNGVWTTPFQLEFNAYHENRKSIIFGDLINHFKSIIGSQPGFIGSPYGRNNFRNISNKHLGLGGTIKEHNGAFNKFLSLLNQENISPLSIIDFGETQYAQALNSVNEYINKYAIEFLTKLGTPTFNGSNDTSGIIKQIVTEYCDYYKQRSDISSYLGTSTSVIPNWPATLPSLGLAKPVGPKFGFDNELGINVIIHHDGHLSPKNQKNVEFERALIKLSVTRSDGSVSTGSLGANAPSLPFKNQLWFDTKNNELKLFNIVSDSSIAPPSSIDGDFWFDRNAGALFKFVGDNWELQQDILQPWKIIETEKILNGVILEIETLLFKSVNQNNLPINWDNDSNLTIDALEFELSKFASKYGYDQYATDFKSNDSFTWNYKRTHFDLIGNGRARWHDVYKAYFAASTGTQFTTCRPNIEPWKLFGLENPTSAFIQRYAGNAQDITAVKHKDVDVILIGEITAVTGCVNNVDGKLLIVGDRVLVTEGANAGVYVVTTIGTGNNGVWAKAENFAVGDFVKAKFGANWNGTSWKFVSSNIFEQMRMWKMEMWSDLVSDLPSEFLPNGGFPTLKLCVNVFNETLLPPYVDALSPVAFAGLTNIIGIGINDSYLFGENGPTELVWRKSLEHSYSLLRIGMRNQPLRFIESTWGDVYRSANGLALDKQSAKKISHIDFTLHGESLPAKNRARIILLPLPPLLEGAYSIELVCDLVTDDRDFFKIYVNGTFIGHRDNFDQSFGIDFSKLEINDNGEGFEIGDKISFSISGGVISNEIFESAKVKTFIGIGQWFTQVLQYNSHSLTQSKNNTLFRKWDVKLGYRFGAFMNTSTLKMSSNYYDIPVQMCNVVNKISPFMNSAWLNALRIQLVSAGSSQLDGLIYKPAQPPHRDPSFWETYDGTSNEYVQAGDDWVFRVETYLSSQPKIEYYEYETRKQETYDDIETYIDANGQTQSHWVQKTRWVNADHLTFNALEKRRSIDTWNQFTKIKAVKTVSAPLLIKGIQNVINFLFGYTNLLHDRGWRINESNSPINDAETGRLVTWQLEIEKFVDAVFDNMQPGNGSIINPFMRNVWFNSATGLVGKFDNSKFADSQASQFVFDMVGNHIPVEQLKVIREEDVTSIISDTPMFGMHVNIEEYEHAVIFPYYLDNAKKDKLIFDPFLGLRLHSMLIAGSRQAIQSGRPSFGGFYLHNNEMKRNIVSTIDDIGRMYDSEVVFNNPEISKHALALFGFSTKEYFDDIGVSKKNQFNFWRGLIQAKGTNSSINAFLNNAIYEDAKIDEYWAFKIAEYGDARVKSFPELKLLASDCLLDTTRFQFTDSGISTLPSFTPLTSNDESRWANLTDITELSKRGMFFDANVNSDIFAIEEKPQFGEIDNPNPWQNRVPLVSDAKINSHIDSTTLFISMLGNEELITLTMADLIANGLIEDDDLSFTNMLELKNEVLNNVDATLFDVSDLNTGVSFGIGRMSVPFTRSPNFQFTLNHDLAPVQKLDAFTIAVKSSNISKFVKLPFTSDKLLITKFLPNGTSVQVDPTDNSTVKIISQNIIEVKQANTPITIEGFGPQKPKFSPIKLFDYKNDTFLGNISFWHPAIGQHTPEAYDIINMIAPSDPAKYNQTTQVLNNPNYDILKPWGQKEVGKVWWNNNNVEYTPYYDDKFYPDLENRLSKWGALADYSSIEVYEWVESNVSPELYDAQVLAEAKDQTIPQNEKKTGEVAKSKLLTRARTWLARPIAWKKNEHVGDSPFFTSSYFNKIFLTSYSVGSSRAILGFGRFADYGVTAGMSLSAWDFINDIPVGEATILADTEYVIGTSENFFMPKNFSVYDANPIIALATVNDFQISTKLALTIDKSTRLSSIGKTLGQIKISSVFLDGGYFLSATETSTGKTQVVAINDIKLSKSSIIDYDFTEIGIKLRLSAPELTYNNAAFTALHLSTIIGNLNHDIFIRESVALEFLIGIDDAIGEDRILSNETPDSTSVIVSNRYNYGWRAWINPTQAELSADIKSPDNLWVPIFGNFTNIYGSTELVSTLPTNYMAKIKSYQDSKLVLNNGEIIERFKSNWTSFVQLDDASISSIYTGSAVTSVLDLSSITTETILDKSRVFVYLNGTLHPSSSFAISKMLVTITAKMDIGTKISVIYKRYQPLATELKFEPDVADDISINTQYKFSFDFTVSEQRDSNGKIGKSLYYFWVKNKNTPPKNQKMSVQQAANLLTTGPSLYMAFHNINDATYEIDNLGNFVLDNNDQKKEILPIRYDSITIFGLNKFVTQDNSYKLRFTRNFTLRDNPQDLDLKNVHAEWALIRPGQPARIPSALWDKMVDSAAGIDIIGNGLPFTYLVDYDNQHGTSNQFGLGNGQVLGPKENILTSIKHTILNTQVKMNIGGAQITDYIRNLKLSQLDKYFDTPDNIRKTLDFIWREAKPKQINEIFFAVINDALANNFEFADIFKTSRLSVYSIKTVGQILTGQSDE